MDKEETRQFDRVKPAKQRLQFIDARLAWVGEIGRGDITDQFAISKQQATSDLGEYASLAPDNLRYSPRQRRYVKDSNFKPAFRTTNVRNFLRRLVGVATRPTQRAKGWVGDLDLKVVSPHRREPSEKVLLPLLRAIRERNIIAVDYVSMTSGKTEGRRVAPHALGYDGFRWHARVWDYKRNDYIDLVLTRIAVIGGQTKLDDELPSDWRWNDNFQFSLRPDSNLSPEKRRAIAFEFGIPTTDWQSNAEGSPHAKLSVETTHAMLFYKLRLYGFDPRQIRDGQRDCKSMFGLELCDEERVREALN